MATIIKGSTHRGQNFILGCEYKVGFRLEDIYGSFSQAKQNGWNYCFEKYLNTPEHENFRITGYNQTMFTVAWDGLYDGQPALFVETHKNSYIILKNA